MAEGERAISLSSLEELVYRQVYLLLWPRRLDDAYAVRIPDLSVHPWARWVQVSAPSLLARLDAPTQPTLGTIPRGALSYTGSHTSCLLSS